MKSLRLIIATALVTLTASAIAAPGAQADMYSCAFTGGMGPVSEYDQPEEVFLERGIEAIASDALNDEGDGIIGGGGIIGDGGIVPIGDNSLTSDTDNGNGSGETTGQDGSYSFATATNGAVCAYAETGGDPGRVSGLYRGTIGSWGEYDSIVCGTGWFADDDVPSGEVTSVAFGNPVIADILDFKKFRMDVAAGQGAIDLGFAENADGESGSGRAVDGSVTLVPTWGNCVTEDVNSFAVAGTFTVTTSH